MCASRFPLGIRQNVDRYVLIFSLCFWNKTDSTGIRFVGDVLVFLSDCCISQFMVNCGTGDG